MDLRRRIGASYLRAGRLPSAGSQRALATLCESYWLPLYSYALRVFITPRHDDVRAAEVGQQLNMSEGAVRAGAHRLRKRYRAILRAEIAETVENSKDVEDEIRSLFQAFV